MYDILDSGPRNRFTVSGVIVHNCYGMGVNKLAESTGLQYEQARDLRDAYYAAFPEVKDLLSEMKNRARMNLPIRTWGGREYYCEPPKLVNGKIMDFSYKLGNILIQGGAADCTKEAMCRYHESGNKWPMLMTLHDELIIEAPRDEAMEATMRLMAAMQSVEFDVPMLTDAKISDVSWVAMTKVEAN